jgi:hypothetical protein
LIADALFEYRRGLRINPYAAERLAYADILKLQGYPEQYLEEIQFLRELGKGSRAINDAIETYSGILAGSIYRRWKVDPVELKRHWNIAVFAVANQSSFLHTDAAFLTASYLKDILVHDRNINTLNLDIRQSSFASAFRSAREGDKQSGISADYFLIISISENERDVALKAELFVARTGAAAATFNVYRAGGDRLRNAARAVEAQLDAALPFRGVLIRRAADQGLLDKGALDGIKKDTVYEVVKKGRIDVQSEGIALKYAADDVLGTFTVGEVGEEVSGGSLSKRGFFDLITEGDEVIMAAPPPPPPPDAGKKADPAGGGGSQTVADPELQALLRTLR